MKNRELKREKETLRRRKPKEEDKGTQPEIRDSVRNKALELLVLKQLGAPSVAEDGDKCKVKVWLKATSYIGPLNSLDEIGQI